jgi:acyl carrier protein
MSQAVLKKIFVSVLGLPEEGITPGLSPDNTPSWDSLNAIILITEIEKAFQMKFGFDEAMGARTFGDVVNLLQAKGVEFHD